MANATSKANGIGCLTVVGIVFLVLKLLAVPPVAGWSWWLVLAPFWIQLVAVIIILTGIGFTLLLLANGNKAVNNVLKLKKGKN